MAELFLAGDGKSGEALVDGRRYRIEVHDGLVRCRLPYAVNMERLAALLWRESYPMANPPERADSQGWGPYFDAEGYYPYWVFPVEGDGHWVFAFPPEGHLQLIGPDAITQLQRWLPLLAQARDDVKQTH